MRGDEAMRGDKARRRGGYAGGEGGDEASEQECERRSQTPQRHRRDAVSEPMVVDDLPAIVQQSVADPEEALHEHRVLVVVLESHVDGGTREVFGRIVDEPEPVVTAPVAGHEVEALVAGHAHLARGKDEREEGRDGQTDGDQVVPPVESALQVCQGA